MKYLQIVLLIASIFLSSCSQEAQTSTASSLTATIRPPTETDTPIPFTETSSAPTQDPTLFGAIGVDEIQAYALESVASAIFTNTMDSFKATGLIQEFQILRVTIFPAGDGLLSEITFDVKTTDPAWLADGGTQADDNWINDKCNRFDFVTTETEYQLRNKRLCN